MYCGGEPEPKALQVLIMEYKYISCQSTTEFNCTTQFLKCYIHTSTCLLTMARPIPSWLCTSTLIVHALTKVPNSMNVYKLKHRAVVFTNC